MSAIRIAIEGCGHGTLNAIYDSIKRTCKINKFPPVDLLIIGGDFQAVRNLRDLNVMSCPPKYRALGDFHEYYSGVRKAPMLTVFVGGNHEASSHLWELFYGGWVAPNIYYMGAASVLNFRGLRIGGLSGIYNGRDYLRAHDERLPYFPGEIKSIYHVRQYDVFKLYQIKEPVDVVISHDWPSGIEHHGDLDELLRRKSFFKSDIEKGELGSPPARSLLNKLKPRYWFSAHLHVKFAALVDHGKSQEEEVPIEGKGKERAVSPVEKNPDELDLDMDLEETAEVKVVNQDEIELDLDGGPEAAAPKNKDEIELDLDEHSSEDAGVSLKNTEEIDLEDESTVLEDTNAMQLGLAAKSEDAQASSAVRVESVTAMTGENKVTNFIALDKCLPNREFLQLLSIPVKKSKSGLSYDPEWLAITRALNPYLHKPPSVLNSEDFKGIISQKIAEERKWVEENIVVKGKLGIPKNFEITAPIHEGSPNAREDRLPESYINAQTTAFCELLGIEDGTRFAPPGSEQKEERYRRFAADGGGSYLRGGRGGGGRGGGGRGGRGRGGGRNR
ncbi:DBR1-domain-containing protein [Choiromyces venosus 120613-1]|uniref:DBR1-domain-containing protein n=1 Tax=Choiromyces venosus 120613-1 TaxID=1336337 RepID=A0A3N4JXG6_9PEZI|nr:DBR1-domain-containing protein [Choiromyces venosus 120613-1]